MTPIDVIIRSIDGRLAEIRREISSLEAGRAALVANGHPKPKRASVTKAVSKVVADEVVTAKPAAPRKASARKSARRVKRDPVPAGKLEAILSEHEGLGSRELAKLANGDQAQVLTLLRELEAAGQVRRTGQRRGTRWHIVTDEDRIAARVAELEAASSSA